MNAVATINYDREYFEYFYTSWLTYRSRWRRFAIPVAIVFVALAVTALFLPDLHPAVSYGVFVVAVLNLFDAATHRFRWVRQRLASVAVDKTAELTFTVDKIRIITPNSDGTLTYNAFGQVSVTSNGIFLVPDSGVSIYVPRTAFASDEEFYRVTAKLEEHATQHAKSIG
ncbi:YcxB family protein [Novipirellula sp.]|uniref:YcxB family protein n=1 Tax=Novipirellula sp. TaxID=2795430 RepID=UPI00356B4014